MRDKSTEQSIAQRSPFLVSVNDKETTSGNKFVHSFIRYFNPIQARLFYSLKVQGGPLMISGTIKASPMKLPTVIGT